MSSGLRWHDQHVQQEVLIDSDGHTVGRVERDGFAEGVVWVAFSEPDGNEIGRYPTRAEAKTASERRIISEWQAGIAAELL